MAAATIFVLLAAGRAATVGLDDGASVDRVNADMRNGEREGEGARGRGRQGGRGMGSSKGEIATKKVKGARFSALQREKGEESARRLAKKKKKK